MSSDCTAPVRWRREEGLRTLSKQEAVPVRSWFDFLKRLLAPFQNLQPVPVKPREVCACSWFGSPFVSHTQRYAADLPSCGATLDSAPLAGSRFSVRNRPGERVPLSHLRSFTSQVHVLSSTIAQVWVAVPVTPSARTPVKFQVQLCWFGLESAAVSACDGL